MICHIDCSGILSARQLHEKLSRLLIFPEWYGHNLDALHDCLTDLPSATRLSFSSWDTVAPWASGFEAVLEDAQSDCSELTVVFE